MLFFSVGDPDLDPFVRGRYGSGNPDPDLHQNVTDPNCWFLII
jgi:hypothetical protein